MSENKPPSPLDRDCEELRTGNARFVTFKEFLARKEDVQLFVFIVLCFLCLLAGIVACITRWF